MNYDVIIVGAGAGGGVAAGVAGRGREAGAAAGAWALAVLRGGRTRPSAQPAAVPVRQQRRAGRLRTICACWWMTLASGTSCGPMTAAITTTPRASAVAHASMAGRRGASCRRISGWRAPTASRTAVRWPTGPSPMRTWHRSTSRRNGSWVWREMPRRRPICPQAHVLTRCRPCRCRARGHCCGRAPRRLGWTTTTVPLLINSVPRGGRDACIHCQHCVGFACPSDAKNGTQNTMIPRALASQNCDLVTEAMVERVETDAAGPRRRGPLPRCRRAASLRRGRTSWCWPVARSRRRACCCCPQMHKNRRAWGTTRIKSEGICKGTITRPRSVFSPRLSGTAWGRAPRRRPAILITATTASSAAGCWPTTSSSCRSSSTRGCCHPICHAGARPTRRSCAMDTAARSRSAAPFRRSPAPMPVSPSTRRARRVGAARRPPLRHHAPGDRPHGRFMVDRAKEWLRAAGRVGGLGQARPGCP